MPRRFRSRPLVVFAALAACTLAACGDRASGENAAAGSAAAKPGRSAPSACPSVEQVGAAAGFPVTFAQSIGSDPDTWMICQYEMTGRYRGTFVALTGEPASKAELVYTDIKRAVKGLKGQDAEADRLDLGSGGWAYGSNSGGEAAAVVGSHVYHATLVHMGLGSVGDQKDAIVRVLKLIAH
jgi:hypothetical protein